MTTFTVERENQTTLKEENKERNYMLCSMELNIHLPEGMAFDKISSRLLWDS